MPFPIPDCPPPISEFSKSFSVDAELSISMSTFTTDYCVGKYFSPKSYFFKEILKAY